MKEVSSQRRLIVLVIALGMGLGWYQLRHGWKEPKLIYKAPDIEPIIEVPVEQSKYEEYEAILEKKQKDTSQKPKKSRVRFGLARLFKPKASTISTSPVAQGPSKASSKQPKQKPPVQPYFFAYQGEEKADSLIAAAPPPAHFFKARVYKAQQVKDQGGVVVKLQEKIELPDKTLPPGTLLYGKAKFGQDRMYVVFTVAKWKEVPIPIHLQGYDQDLLLGFTAPGLVPSLSDHLERKALQKATHQRGSGWLQEIGKEVAGTWKEARKKKEAFLEDRKGVYVRMAGKKKS